MRIAKTTFLMCLLVPTFVFATEAKKATLPKDSEPPAISLEKAIKFAEQCLKVKKVDVSDSYLKSAIFENTNEAKLVPSNRVWYWSFFWMANQPKPEGTVSVRVYEDGECLVSEGNSPWR